ncbi:unnamed protein product [Adineta steineri]|uniref:Homeobox domain-containing protein n=1 Tax=Adineta steineri TaxID=433720 RepID=A0A815KXM0_9BILA|nr:unnamed protein product [Adineta steineri]CAF1613595.1 unnamed protein product [Adineta steineri]
MGTVTSNDEQNQPTNESKIKHQRCRRTFTYYQIVELEKAFSYCKCPTKREHCELARRSGLNERQVRIWFLNRYSNEMGEGKHNRLSLLPGGCCMMVVINKCSNTIN